MPGPGLRLQAPFSPVPVSGRRSTSSMKFTVLFLAGVLLFGSCEKLLPGPENENEIAAGQNQLALDLYKILTERADEGNVFISPFSLATCLAMLYMMANTTTAHEIAGVLHMVNNDQEERLPQQFKKALLALDEESFWLANRVFLDEGFEVRPSYREAVKEYMGADCESLDFANRTEFSRQHINSWVANQTKGKIAQLLKPGSLSMDIDMVLVSTVYFKGKWQQCFFGMDEMDFTSENGNTTRVKMLKLFDKFGFAEIPSINGSVLSVPYLDNNQSLLIILPDRADGFAEMERKIVTLDITKEILDEIKYTPTVKAAFPEFKMEKSYELRSPLKQLGMKSAFNGHISDFSKGVSTSGLEVSKVYHKTAIHVSEEGTEAAASTGADLYLKSGVVIDFTADRPFMFAITDNKSKSIMFLGRFIGPDQ